MDDLERVERFVVKHGDEATVSAWLRLTGRGANPPSPLRRAAGASRELAQQFAKTGLLTEWRTPPQHSVAMERLTHKLTNLLQAYLDLLEGRGGGRPGAATEPVPIWQDGKAVTWPASSTQPWVIPADSDGSRTVVFWGGDDGHLYEVDGAYQAAFCDECGGELAPDGRCAACSAAAL